MTLVAVVYVGGAKTLVPLVPSETVVTRTEKDGFSHLATSSH